MRTSGLSKPNNNIGSSQRRPTVNRPDKLHLYVPSVQSLVNVPVVGHVSSVFRDPIKPVCDGDPPPPNNRQKPVCFPRKNEFRYFLPNFLSRESAGKKMIITEEPILPRLDRLDKVLKQWEERRGSNNRSPRSSWASTTPSSGTHGRESDFSMESQEKLCRPINAVVMETEMKGTLLERLVHVENQALKLCFHLEEELEAGVKREEKALLVQNAHKKKKDLNQLVKSCVEGGRTREI